MAEKEINETKPAKAEKDSKPAEKKKKRGFASRIVHYFKDLKGEFKKIVWPTKKQVVNNTIVVLVCMVIVGAFIWGLDALLGFLTSFLYK